MIWLQGTKRGVVGAVVLLVCLLMGGVLSACGGKLAAEGSDSNTAAGESTFGSDGSHVSRENLPGTEEFGLTKQEMVAAIEEGEKLIAQCMRENGFEYIAVDYNTVRRGMQSDKSLPGYSERQFFEEFGFGISTLYSGNAPQLSEIVTPSQIGLGERNLAIFKNLSEADQVAYNNALLGGNTNTTFAVGLEIEDFTYTGGCTRRAVEQIFTPEQLTMRATSPKDMLIEQDPRMVEAMNNFSSCLRQEGFDYGRESEIEPDLRDKVAEITGGAPLATLSADAQAALTELQQIERALAVATLRCEGQHLDPVEDQVERELFGR